MDRFLPFSEDQTLVLNPQWTELGGTTQTLLILLVCGVPLGLVFWLYRYEMHLVKRGTALTLLCLRVLALSLLLLLVCFQPAYSRPLAEELQDRVIVAVDVSASMNVADPQREPVDKLKVARALKLNGKFCSDVLLNDWIAQLEAKKPLTFVGPDEFLNEPDRRRTEAAQREKSYTALQEHVDQLTRAQAVKRLLSAEGLRWLERLRAKHKDRVEIIAFAGGVTDVKPDSVEKLFNLKEAPRQPKPEDEKELTADYLKLKDTNLALPLDRALKLSAEKQGKILGVILLSDGQHRGGEEPVKLAMRLGQQKTPLFPIAFGSDKAPPDAAVIGLKGPATAFKEVEAPLDIRIRASGLKAQDLKVIAHRPGEIDKPLAERILKHDGDDRIYSTDLQVLMDKEGQHAIQVSVLPQGENVKEVNADNNRRGLVINVADDTSKVLLVDGEGRWEFHYLWQALLRDRSMKVKSVLFDQPRLNKIPRSELEKINHPLSALPPLPLDEKERDKDPLFAYDCIILGDVTPEQMPHAERQRLKRYVADSGGTLVVLAGKRAMPLGYRDDIDKVVSQPKGPNAVNDQDPLLELLPIESPRQVAPPDGFHVTLTEEGKQTTFLRLQTEGGLTEQLERWATMQPHNWGVIGKAKPGAMTLAYLAHGDKATEPEEPVKKELDEKAKKEAQEKRQKELDDQRAKEDNNALFVRHNYGFGRVFFVGVDSTWRYRFRVGDTYHHRFWSQTIRWAASDKPLMTGNKFVRFGTSAAIIQDPEPVKLMVRLQDALEKLPAKLDVKARIIRKDGDKETAVAEVPLTLALNQHRVLEGQVRGLDSGKYEIELVSPELTEQFQGEPGVDGKTKPLRSPFEVSSGEHAELLKLSAELQLLKNLAAANRHELKNEPNADKVKLYTPETAGEVIELLTGKGTVKTSVDKTFLYSWWPTLLILLTLLTVEWVLRKWVGLP